MNNLIRQIIESKFNFNIDNIEDNENRNSLSKSAYKSKSLRYSYDKYAPIDLGLPSKTLWYRYNLGVNVDYLEKPEDWYGGYYAWGELEEKEEYDWNTYKFNISITETRIIKYNKTDSLTTLELKDDAAYLNLHIGNYEFRIPSSDQMEELVYNTTREWITNYNNVAGLNGQLFKSKENGNELFFPACGHHECKSFSYYGLGGYYWTSDLYTRTPYFAWALTYHNSNTDFIDINFANRRIGFSIHPVFMN